MLTKYTKIIRLFLVSIALICAESSMGQIPGFDKITRLSLGKDSAENKSEIKLENVNNEIEFTDNLIVKYSLNDFSKRKLSEQISKIEELDVYIQKQGSDFKEFVPNKTWRFFLINARVNWNEFSDQLRNIQKKLQKDIRDLQEQQDQYVSNKNKWKIYCAKI